MNRRARRWKAAYQDIAEIREQAEPQGFGAADFIKSAKVLAEPYEEDIARLRARAEAAEATLAAIREWKSVPSPRWRDLDDILDGET